MAIVAQIRLITATFWLFLCLYIMPAVKTNDEPIRKFAMFPIKVLVVKNMFIIFFISSTSMP